MGFALVLAKPCSTFVLHGRVIQNLQAELLLWNILRLEVASLVVRDYWWDVAIINQGKTLVLSTEQDLLKDLGMRKFYRLTMH